MKTPTRLTPIPINYNGASAILSIPRIKTQKMRALILIKAKVGPSNPSSMALKAKSSAIMLKTPAITFAKMKLSLLMIRTAKLSLIMPKVAKTTAKRATIGSPMKFSLTNCYGDSTLQQYFERIALPPKKNKASKAS